MALHWSIPLLKSLLQDDLAARLESDAAVDKSLNYQEYPNNTISVHDGVDGHNGGVVGSSVCRFDGEVWTGADAVPRVCSGGADGRATGNCRYHPKAARAADRVHLNTDVGGGLGAVME